MSATNDGGDARELLGLRTVAAKVIIVAYVLTFLLLALVTAQSADALWAQLSAWVIVSCGAIVLVHYPGDPLPVGVSVGLTLAGPAALNLVLAVTDTPLVTLLQTWPIGAATAISTYMCVRGRTPWAWAGMIVCLASCALWAHRAGEGAGYGLSMTMINLAPLLMSTFFAWTIRPAAREIFELREQTMLRVAAEAGDLAILEERDRQLRRLDRLARPLLERIAHGEDLTDTTRTECRLLEAHLRDSLRAPVLSGPDVASAARAARARGVEVILLDDHGMDDVPEEIRDGILASIVELLDGAGSGRLTVRVLPPGRVTLVTVLHDDADDIVRTELGVGGAVRVRQVA